jgi:hypothetical protein
VIPEPWVEALQAGDEVIVQRHMAPDSLGTVDKRLKQHVVVGGLRFRLDGWVAGDGFARLKIAPATPEAAARIRSLGQLGAAVRELARLHGFILADRVWTVPTDRLERARKLLDEAVLVLHGEGS